MMKISIKNQKLQIIPRFQKITYRGKILNNNRRIVKTKNSSPIILINLKNIIQITVK